MKRMKLIAVAGGIGSGKSIISTILRKCGYAVYDCDSRARAIMDCSVEIKRRIACEIAKAAIVISEGESSWDNALIDRKRLAEEVFSDAEKLQRLNVIVHGAVRNDISRWLEYEAGEKGNDRNICFVETAILHSSGVDKLVDAIWHVTAPMPVAVARASRRDNASAESIIRRIESQRDEEKAFETREAGKPVVMITNDGIIPVLPQIISLLEETEIKL